MESPSDMWRINQPDPAHLRRPTRRESLRLYLFAVGCRLGPV